MKHDDKHRWGTADGKPPPIREFDLRSEKDGVYIARYCAGCKRLILFPWNSKTGSRKYKLRCSTCRKKA